MMNLNAIFHIVLINEALQIVALINYPIFPPPRISEQEFRPGGNLSCRVQRPPNSCEDFPPREPSQGFLITPPPEWRPTTWAPLPIDMASPINQVVVASCNSQTKQQDFWDKMISGTDLTILLGDTVYGDCFDSMCSNLEWAYVNLTQSPAFRNFAASVPVVATWDDHDFGMNDAGAKFPWKRKSKELFLKFFDVPASDIRHSENRGLYTSYLFGPPGKTLQVIMLDLRWYKSDFLVTPYQDIPGLERYMPSYDPSLTLLGDEQWAWLEIELQRPAQIRLLGTSLQLMTKSHGFECWHCAPRERDRLIQLCASASPRPYILSGDRHFSGIYKNTGLWEMTSSSLTHTDDGWSKLEMLDPHRIGPFLGVNNFGIVKPNWTDYTVSFSFQPL